MKDPNDTNERDESRKPDGPLDDEKLEQVSGGTQGRYYVTSVTHRMDSQKPDVVQHNQSDLGFLIDR